VAFGVVSSLNQLYLDNGDDATAIGDMFTGYYDALTLELTDLRGYKPVT